MIYILAGTGAEAEAYIKDHRITPEKREIVNGIHFFRDHPYKAGDSLVLVGTWESRTDLPAMKTEVGKAGFAWPDPQAIGSPPYPRQS